MRFDLADGGEFVQIRRDAGLNLFNKLCANRYLIRIHFVSLRRMNVIMSLTAFSPLS